MTPSSQTTGSPGIPGRFTPAASVTETPQPNAPAPPARPPQGGEGPPPAAGAAAPGAPTAPARTVLSGEDLGEIRSPPEQTITALKVPEGFDSGDYAITFEIYGWGPGGKEGGRLVIHIIEAVPGTGVAGISDPSARNALVHIDASSAGAITQGGRYEARLAVREIEPGRGELYLEEVRPAR